MTRPVVRLPDHLRQEIVDHCISELPNEGCGLLASVGDQIVAIYPTGNLEASATGFTVPPDEHFAALADAEARGWELSGVFHSHPNGTAEPSMVDVRTAPDPDWLYVVVGLTRDPPEMGAWRIRGMKPERVGLT